MPRTPQREFPKTSIHLFINSNVLLSVQPLLNTKYTDHLSLSQLIETIIFLSEHMYIEEQDDRFIMQLIDVQAELAKSKLKDSSMICNKHLTLDSHAISFVDMLLARYPVCFKNRSDIIELLIYNIGVLCKTQHDFKYYSKRLSNVLELHL